MTCTYRDSERAVVGGPFALEIGRSQHSNLAAEFERLVQLRPAAAPAIWPASVPAGMPVRHAHRSSATLRTIEGERSGPDRKPCRGRRIALRG